jgi:hypothetical protein
MKPILFGALCFVFCGCNSGSSSSQISNANCILSVDGRNVLCDFVVKSVRITNSSSVTRFNVAGPIILSICPPGGGLSWHSKVNQAAFNESVEPYAMKFKPGGVFLIIGPNEARKLGDFKAPIQGELKGAWSAKACAGLVASSLFNDNDSEWTQKLEKTLAEIHQDEGKRDQR